MQNSIIIACRTNAEATQIQDAGQFQTASIYTEADAVLSRISDVSRSILVMTSLVLDESAIGLATKVTITAPTYTVVWAKHAAKALNVLRLMGCGAAQVLGPDDLDQLPNAIDVSEKIIEDLVFPAFFVDDGISNLKAPDKSIAKRLHVTFLGTQAMMSCCNALLNIKAADAISMATATPITSWCKERIIQNLAEYTLWKPVTDTSIVGGGITLCDHLDELMSLNPDVQHYVICHGTLSPDEENYISTLPSDALVFKACSDGYTDRRSTAPSIPPEKFWDVLISALY